MGRPRLDSEGRRSAIVAAAMPLFARAGFAGTTTKEIARAAGVSEALVFQHFSSKAALYEAIVGQGCEGDPALEKLLALPPSTATLVAVVELMLDHFASSSLSDPTEGETHHRLMLHSFLEDGDYARLVLQWVGERILPLFAGSLEAAAAAGDLRVDPAPAARLFWFGEHVAAMFAYGRLGGRPCALFPGELDPVLADAGRFILRGLGLREEAIELHQGAGRRLIPTLTAASAGAAPTHPDGPHG